MAPSWHPTRRMALWSLAAMFLFAALDQARALSKCGDGKVCCDECDRECAAATSPCFSLCQSDCATRDGSPGIPTSIQPFSPAPRIPPPAECTTGGICCTNCATTCPGYTISCFSNCTSPCVAADECIAVGGAVAQGVAAAACEATKAGCGMPTVQLLVEEADRVTVETCCRALIGSCQGTAEAIECEVKDGDFGSCLEEDFKAIYAQAVADMCVQAICVDSLCRDELFGDSSCTL
eukprot:evm.model.scf_28.4 EVM.evm.TU.scf_28.4   scf_28:88203-92164(+)